MADHYVKLWASILDSSVWREPPAHRLVWIAMLTMADKHGFVGASIDGLARRANVSEQDAESAVASFLAPDPRSRNQENEGRRIQVVPRGWHILNHGYFRDLQDREEQRVYERTRKAEQRARKSQVVPDTQGHGRDITGQTLVCPLPYSDTDSGAVSGRESTRGKAGKSEPPGFSEFWKAYAYAKDKPAAVKAWKKIRPDDELAARIIAKAAEYSASNPSRECHRYPATWLNGEGWNDELTKPVSSNKNKTGGQLWREQNDGSSWESSKEITLPDVLEEGGY